MSKRLPLRIGPAFLIALILAGLLLWWKHVQDQQRHGPVVVEHQTAPSSGVAGVPDPTFVAQHAAELGLSKKQAEQLARVDEKWGKETADLQRRLDAAAASLQAILQHAATGKLTPADYHAESEAVQALSKELAALRRAYWPRLQALLTPDQQRRAQQAWADAHRLHPPSNSLTPSPAGKGGKG
jgi:hypothetical protein